VMMPYYYLTGRLSRKAPSDREALRASMPPRLSPDPEPLPPHAKVLLATLEHTQRAAQRPTPTRRGNASMRSGLQRVGGMAHSAPLANESGPIQQASSSIWVHPAMDLRRGST
jgi:hypothetical protein